MTSGIHTRRYRARFYRNGDGKFATLSNANVLIYWPHGVGDWVFLSYVLPLLEPTNRYWITRFGDDTVSLMEGNEWATPLYVGIQTPHCHDGGSFGVRHFGLDLQEADSSEKEFLFPIPLYEACVRNKIDAVLQTSFPEVHGTVGFPFHTKGRNILRELASEDCYRHFSLSRSLKTTINFDVGQLMARWIEARLKAYLGLGERRLCVIGRTGYTATGKNWGHRWREEMPEGKRIEGEECRDFIQLMTKKDPKWSFLVMEDGLFVGDDTVRNVELNAFSYAELFGEVGSGSIPFGLVMKALVNFADLVVGVPAGPLHLAMAKSDLPTVGIWTEHFPSWYDEPKNASIHLVSKNVVEQNLDARTGSFVEKEDLRFRLIHAETRVVEGEQVLNAVEQLL